MKTEFYIETDYCGKWIKIKTGSLSYCQGFLDARKDHAPRNGYRIVRQDGVVKEEIKSNPDVCIGMVAGWPTPEQYEYAAEKALAQAKAIREQKLREEAYRARVH